MKAPPLELEEAQARLLALAVPLPIERVDVESALGRYLAEPLKARRTQPASDLSAMDGYAVAAGDLAGPWDVIGESAAGHPFAGEVRPGAAVRISTGAVMPRASNSGSSGATRSARGPALSSTLTKTKPRQVSSRTG